MPFTPIHMGPGILVKSVLQSSFSLMIFGWTQIIMDIQPLIVMLSGQGHIHGFTHTFIGGSLIAIASCVSGKYLIDWALTTQLLGFSAKDRELLGIQLPISWPIAVLSAFVGSFSHVWLDGIMHVDVQPFYPASLDNPFLKWVSVHTLHKLCFYAGVIGGLLYLAVRLYTAKRSKRLPAQ